jgi:pimeloyl-ACP methyl ester carboxylesterase
MSQEPIAVWLTPNPVFHAFHSPLLNHLSKLGSIAHWEYLQNQDEGCSLDNALASVQEYLQTLSQPVHLIGHGLGGWLGLRYSRQFSTGIKSLTLLSVGVDPALDWQAYYYSLYKHLRCPKNIILEQMVYNLFGDQNNTMTHYFLEVLRRDLLSSPSPHSLYQQINGEKGAVDLPLFVCGSEDDLVVSPTSIQGWRGYLKSGRDRVWLMPHGHHFFHYFYPSLVAEQILEFWQSSEQRSEIHSSSFNNIALS